MLLSAWPIAASSKEITATTRVPRPLEGWTDGLALLHASRADEALERFVARQRQRPGDICSFYFPALIYTNFVVDGLDEATALQRGRSLLDDGIKAGESRIGSGDAEPDVRYCLGALYGLRAADRLKRSKYLRAAFDGKKARRVMLDLLEDRPEFVDCRFWIGSYDYFADVLPSLFKFFRSLMFFPGGNKERGLLALQDVADHGVLDRYNALWMLYTINSELERDERGARNALGKLNTAFPDCIDGRLALAWRFARATPPDRARGIALHLETLEHAESIDGPSRRRLVDEVRISLARAYVDDQRPEIAIGLLRPLLDTKHGSPDLQFRSAVALIRALDRAGRHAEVDAVVRELRQRHPGSPKLQELEREAAAFDEASSTLYRALTPARRAGRAGRLDEADAAFRAILAEYGDRGLIYYAKADLDFEAGRNATAEASYRRVVEIGDATPGFLTPVSHLRLGNLLDLDGQRGAAKSAYRKAVNSAAGHEAVRDAAKLFLKRPYTRPDATR